MGLAALLESSSSSSCCCCSSSSANSSSSSRSSSRERERERENEREEPVLRVVPLPASHCMNTSTIPVKVCFTRIAPTNNNTFHI